MSLDLFMPPAKKPQLKRPPRRAVKRAPALVDALAEAAWTEADLALAEALVECDRALHAGEEDAKADALSLLSQALARAARRRGLARIGKSGAIDKFDPAKHELAPARKGAPQRVRIVQQGVARGGEVLIKARVRAVRAKWK